MNTLLGELGEAVSPFFARAVPFFCTILSKLSHLLLLVYFRIFFNCSNVERRPIPALPLGFQAAKTAEESLP